MDIYLILGLFIGLGAVTTGLLMKGANVSILFSPEAIIVILVGTFAAVMNSFPKQEFINIPKIIRVIFRDKAKVEPSGILEEIFELAQKTRKDGLLSLESSIQEMDNKFMKQGLELAVDGADPNYLREILEADIEEMEERHQSAALIFSTAGSASPTLGVLGAVIGLIGALRNLNDTEMLGESIAAAFIATLYGIFFGYVVWHPFASRLKRKSQNEVMTNRLILEGVLAIQEGKNPKLIETQLLAMLNNKERKKYLEKHLDENNQGEK